MRPPDPGPPAIPFCRPYFDRRDVQRLVEPLRCGRLEQGERVERLERAVAQHLGVAQVVAACSGAGALRLALLCAGVGPGQEVLLGAWGEPSAAAAVELCGARPVFCDLDPETLTLDPEAARRRLTPLTTHVLVSHPPGLSTDLRPLIDLCRARRLPLIEDCGPGLGGRCLQGALGTLGLAGCFDLGPLAPITCGEGGLMATNSPNLAETARVLRGGGAAYGPHPADPLLPGHGLTLSDLQGALGASQMDKLGDILAERGEVARRYDELLGPLSWLKRPPGGTCPGHGPYLCLLGAPEAEGSEGAWEGRDRLLAELGRAGICCRQPGRCLPGLSYFQKRYRLRAEDYPHALAAERLAIALPLYVGMSQGEQERVAAELTAAHEIILAERAGERPGEASGEPALPVA